MNDPRVLAALDDLKIGTPPPAGSELPDLPGDLPDLDPPRTAAALIALADAATPYVAPTTPAAPPPPLAVVVAASDVDPERLSWLWPGRIPLGKVTLLFGDPGQGKSLVTLDIAARVSRGLPWPDAPGVSARPGGVVLLSAEDDRADTIVPRLMAAAADRQRINILKAALDDGDEKHFNLSCDVPALDYTIRKTPDCRLVIIDPISAYLGGTDSHKNSEVRSLLAPLSDLASRHGVSIVAVTHMHKGGGGRSLYRAMGSLAFIAAARAGWLIIADAANPKRRLFLPSKANLTQEPTGLAYSIQTVPLGDLGPQACVVWESGPVTQTADAALAAAAVDPEQRTAVDSAADWLQEALAAGPVKSTDLKAEAKDAGVAWATVRRAQKDGGAKIRRQGFGPGGEWYWFLPDAATAPAAGAGDDAAEGGQETPY